MILNYCSNSPNLQYSEDRWLEGKRERKCPGLANQNTLKVGCQVLSLFQEFSQLGRSTKNSENERKKEEKHCGFRPSPQLNA